MKRHVTSVHENKKQFKCEMCDYYFSQKGDLKRHVTAVHENKKQFKCEICEFTCSQKGNLTVHVASVHKKIRNHSYVKFVTTAVLQKVT